MNSNKISWRVNEQISAREVRVIGADSKQIGVLPRNEALEAARKAGLDLVEVSSSANPPVAKIVDFGKFRYQEEKKLKQEKKGTKGGELKEIRFSPFIAENDYQTRIERVKEFLADRNKIKVVVVFMGRQMGSKQFGYDLLKRLINNLGESITIDMEPKFTGRRLEMVISPKSGSTKNVKE